MEKNEDVGMKIILPSTIYGAFRYALDIVRDLEKPHIFITFTCNPYKGGNNCTKNFPKSFQQCTKVTENSYPLYMHRDSHSVGKTQKSSMAMTLLWLIHLWFLTNRHCRCGFKLISTWKSFTMYRL